MDLAPLLDPISADRPTGADLAFSPELDAIQEMRREDDPTLDQGEWVSTLKSADWGGVARGCEQILLTKSKNLQVAGWLADAWARLHGFAGLADGLELTAGLTERHWEALHPQPEGGDMEERAGNLRWLAARVEMLATTIPLVAHAGRRSSLAAIDAARARRLAHGGATSGAPSGAAAGNPPLALEAVWRDISAGGGAAATARREPVLRARVALLRLESAVDLHLLEDAPSFVAARAALDRAIDELARLERECGYGEPAGAAAPSATGDDPDDRDAALPRPLSPGPSSQPPAHIENRAQALEQLRRVAAFFRATEPHSPVAYLADKAVRWSEMPLHEWLRAVVKDGVSLAHLEEMLGVEKPTETY